MSTATTVIMTPNAAAAARGFFLVNIIVPPTRSAARKCSPKTTAQESKTKQSCTTECRVCSLRRRSVQYQRPPSPVQTGQTASFQYVSKSDSSQCLAQTQE